MLVWAGKFAQKTQSTILSWKSLSALSLMYPPSLADDTACSPSFLVCYLLASLLSTHSTHPPFLSSPIYSIRGISQYQYLIPSSLPLASSVIRPAYHSCYFLFFSRRNPPPSMLLLQHLLRSFCISD